MASSNAARHLPSGSGPTSVLQQVKQKIKKERKARPQDFKPGVSGNPNGRPKGTSTRELIVASLFGLLAKIPEGSTLTYQEQMIRTILGSEHLLSKFLDKLLPNMSQDQTNVVFNNFETMLAQVQAQRALVGMNVAPGLPAPIAEPELEPINRQSV